MKGFCKLPVHLYFKDVVGILLKENLKKEKFCSFSEKGKRMKLLRFCILICVSFVFVSGAFASDKPRLGVLRFTNDTNAGWWRASVGSDLQDMLISELASTKSFQVLERKEIDAVLSEQDLGASGRVSKSTKAKMGKLKGAQYLV